jgi:hypothetical protein
VGDEEQTSTSVWIARSVVGLLLSGFGAATSAAFVATGSPLNDVLCNRLGNPRASEFVCSAEKRPISTQQATDFIDGWAASLRGSRREDSSYAVLSRSEDPPSDGYAARWRPVVYLARTGSVEAVTGERNVFTTRVRYFKYVDAVDAEDPPFSVDRVGVYDLTLTFDLSLDSKSRVTSRVPVSSDNHPLPGYARLVIVRAQTDTDFYKGPVRVDDGGFNFLTGASARAICEVEQPDGWWSLSNVGWTPNADLTQAGAQVDGLSECPRPPAG